MILKKIKVVSKSQSKHIKFEYKKCLDGEKCQEECEKYFLKSTDHEMYLQKTKKNIHYLFSMIRII